MEYRKWEKGLLRADGQPGFETPSGKVEIASSILAEHGYASLPVYTEPGEGPLARPDLAARYPLVFNSGARTRWDFRSQHHGVAALARHHPEPRVHLNERDAAARGIRDGDLAWVETPRGRLRFRAQVDGDLVPGAVDAAQGGGGPLGPAAWRTTNVNELTDPARFDPISGFPIYEALLCEVRLAAPAAEADAAGGGRGGDAEDPEADGAVAAPAPGAARRVYLDANATTPVAPEVVRAMVACL
jgi:anaerobic selenocysteine-containing dehydrogenase